MGSIRSATSVISDIASASAEQATGPDEINKALAQMDEVTQQNSALVEENAATAKTLEHQAQAMDQQVAFFTIAESGAGQDIKPAAVAAASAKAVPVPAPAARTAHVKNPKPAVALKAARAFGGGGPLGVLHKALASDVAEDNWKEF
jgi:hypothetical protein